MDENEFDLESLDEYFECGSCGEDFLEGEGRLEDGVFICNECIIERDSNVVNAQDELTEGTKYDSDKLRFDLVPLEYSVSEAAIFTMGAEKYDDNNWKKGIKFSRLVAAALRHIALFMSGQVLDVESGLPHLAHARWNLGALMYFDARHDEYEEFDDLDIPPAYVLELLSSYFPWKEQD